MCPHMAFPWWRGERGREGERERGRGRERESESVSLAGVRELSGVSSYKGTNPIGSGLHTSDLM